MKRVRFGIGILLALLFISIGAAWTIHMQTKALLTKLDQLETAVETDAMDTADTLFEEFERQWEKSEQLMNFIIRRDKIMQLDLLVSRLNPMRTSDCDELKAELAAARVWLTHLDDGEHLTLQNIF